MAFLNVYYPKTHLIKTFYSLDYSKPNGRLSQTPRTGGFRELFLPENDFKTCSATNFANKQVLDAWKPIKDMKFRLEFFFTCPSTYEFNMVF